MKYYVDLGYVYIDHNAIILRYNNWDDYGYKTTFNASFCDGYGNYTELGTIKIAKHTDDGGEDAYSTLPASFDNLPDGYYSLWQSADAYEAVKRVSDETHSDIFRDLNDIANDLSIFEKYSDDSVLGESLLCDDLKERIRSAEDYDKNSWKSALYRGLLNQLDDYKEWLVQIC